MQVLTKVQRNEDEKGNFFQKNGLQSPHVGLSIYKTKTYILKNSEKIFFRIFDANGIVLPFVVKL